MPPARPRWLRRLLRGAMLVAVAAVAVIGGAWWLGEGRFIVSTDNAYVQGDIAVLGARIEGDVAEINAGDNQPVRAGDPLVTLDARDWQAKLDQSRATAAEAAAAIITAQR